MRLDLDAGAGRLELSIDDGEELKAFVEGALRDEGFVVDLAEPLKLFHHLEVVLRHGAVERRCSAQVVQQFGRSAAGVSTALRLEDPEVLADLPQAAAFRPADRVERGEMQGTSPVFRLQQMQVPERMRLAMKAGRPERQILLRDSSPQVLMGLLANPRLEEKEVVELVKSPSAASGVLERVAKDRRWSSHYEIRLNVVRNPRTPPLVAQRLLPGLNKKDLGVLSKSGAVREVVRKAALRLYLKRL